MKSIKYIIFVILIAILNQSFAQNTINEVVPTCYTKYHTIEDKQYGKVWDRSINLEPRNVYMQSEHGGDNQLWLIMPTYPGSQKAIFINKYGGTLDKSSSHGNLQCYDSFHGGTNQLFNMDKLSDGYFIITSMDNGQVADVSGSSRHYDPWEHPSQYHMNLYCNTRHDGNNQRFKPYPESAIPNSGNLRIYKRDANLNPPPPPMGLDDTGISGKHCRELVAETIIPCALVDDNYLSLAWKTNNSPYYRLEQYQYFKLIAWPEMGNGVAVVHKDATTVGISSTDSKSIAETLDIKMSYTNEAKEETENSNTGTENSMNINANFKREEVEGSSTTFEEQKIVSIEISKTIIPEQRLFVYILVNEYKLYRMNKSAPILDWSVSVSKAKQYMSWPPSDPEKSNQKSASNVTEHVVLTAPSDLIPDMSYYYCGDGYVQTSSSYSSTYASYKAVDANTATLWISKPNGSFSNQWLRYDFYDEQAATAYSIHPQTAHLVDRAPYSWKLQGSNDGSSWTTLDSRSGYNSSYWLANHIRSFSIPQPRWFKKYRLLITQVNGSTVASIHNFELYGKKSTLAKSKKKAPIVVPEMDETVGVPNVTIFPNPSSGKFSVFFEHAPYFSTDSISGNESVNVDMNAQNKIQIFNSIGKMVYVSQQIDNPLNLDLKLEQGLYMVRIKFNGEEFTKKLVIE